MSEHAGQQPTFHNTSCTHEIVVDRVRLALATDLAEAKLVARAISRAMSSSTEVHIYAAFADLPHSSYRDGWRVT